MTLKQKNTFLAIGVILVVAVSFIFGFKLKEKESKKTIELLNLDHATLLSQKDSEIEELKLCSEDRGQQIDAYTEPYNYKTFGISSELLANTEVQVIKYRYCEADVVEKFIDLKDKTIRVQYIENLGPHSKSFSNNILGTDFYNNFRDIPTFDGYENYPLRATLVSDSIDRNWSEKESYTSKNDIQSFYVKNYAPKMLASISLQFYSTSSPLGASMFVTISQNVDFYLIEEGNTDKAILEAKNQLNKFMDTVSIEY